MSYSNNRIYRFGPSEQAPGEWSTMEFEARDDEQAKAIARLSLKGRGPHPATPEFRQAVKEFGGATLRVEYTVWESEGL